MNFKAMKRYFPVVDTLVGDSAYEVIEDATHFRVVSPEGKEFYSVRKETYTKHFQRWMNTQYMAYGVISEFDRARGWGYWNTDVALFDKKRINAYRFKTVTGVKAQGWCLYYLDRLNGILGKDGFTRFEFNQSLDMESRA